MDKPLGKVVCPFCGSHLSTIIEGRPHLIELFYWRRRRCLDCQETFTTTETVQPTDRPARSPHNI